MRPAVPGAGGAGGAAAWESAVSEEAGAMTAGRAQPASRARLRAAAAARSRVCLDTINKYSSF